MIIDGHIHIGRWSSVFFNYESTVGQAIDVMKRSGVEAAVCMPADAEPNIKLLNESVNNKSFRFYFTPWINPDDTTLDTFLDNNLSKIHFFKFHPSIHGRRITDITFSKYLKLAEENGIPVIIHCGRWQEIASYKYPLELTTIYPDLNIILAHLGGDQPALYMDCASQIKEKKYKNVFLGTESVREFYFVNKAVNTAGTDKVIFGSDYNLGLPGMYIPIIESLSVTQSDKELIYSGNILRLINNRESYL